MNRVTKSRWASKPLNGQSASLLPYDHPAVLAGRTIYPGTVYLPSRNRDAHSALKRGENSKKIGGEILKRKWKGYPVYTLTLEERATCPTTCRHWRSCYGNKMNWAWRMQAGPDLEFRLVREVAMLAIDYPDGFAVRLHNLSDFYSVEYVELWGRLLERHPALHIWGYTAHVEGSIFAALASLRRRYPDRFAMRFSNAHRVYPTLGGATEAMIFAHRGADWSIKPPPGPFFCLIRNRRLRLEGIENGKLT